MAVRDFSWTCVICFKKWQFIHFIHFSHFSHFSHFISFIHSFASFTLFFLHLINFNSLLSSSPASNIFKQANRFGSYYSHVLILKLPPRRVPGTIPGIRYVPVYAYNSLGEIGVCDIDIGHHWWSWLFFFNVFFVNELVEFRRAEGDGHAMWQACHQAMAKRSCSRR